MTPTKIRQKSVTAKAESVREMLAAVTSLPLASAAEFSSDPRMVAAGESFLRRALEGLLDLGRHVLAKGFGKVVPEYAAVADELEAQGILGQEGARKLRLMARYRNRMVHFYDDITPAELYGILTRERGDVEEVLAAILAWLAAHPEASTDEL
ncbi:MAG TPA: DUF86 domain-containing protein [Thermoanaerobaculia bacterium]|jgi:uncharacterized protein YutE (UPF0331/DUF86 family)